MRIETLWSGRPPWRGCTVALELVTETRPSSPLLAHLVNREKDGTYLWVTGGLKGDNCCESSQLT